MKRTKSNMFSKIFSIFTALVLLNMSLIMAEVSALKLNKDRALIETIAKLIAGAFSEEESDSSEGMADEDVSVKEIDMAFICPSLVTASALSISNSNIVVRNQGLPRFGNYEIYSPPPEV
ncbi:MAG: hypothetical protein ABI477_11200 [Chryseolinea sp.]